MKLTTKILILFFGLAILFLSTYGIFGEQLELIFSEEKCIQWFAQIKPYGWLISIGLLVSDILLPIPATGVMVALGAVYGTFLGTVIGTCGVILAAVTGYGCGKMADTPKRRWITSEDEIEQFRSFFERWGAGAVIISRAMPVMPEVISILAGMSGMRFIKFTAAVSIGAFPVCLFHAWLGSVAGAYMLLGMAAAIGISFIVWMVFNKLANI